jgi:hypothetical protein
MRLYYTIIIGLLLLVGCTQSDQTSTQDSTPPTIWPIDSMSFYADDGTSEELSDQQKYLELYENIWIFGDLHGTWRIKFIEDADWQRWGIAKFHTDKKIVMKGWDGDEVDGPIKEMVGEMTSLLLLYQTKIKEKNGQVQIMFEVE